MESSLFVESSNGVLFSFSESWISSTLASWAWWRHKWQRSFVVPLHPFHCICLSEGLHRSVSNFETRDQRFCCYRIDADVTECGRMHTAARANLHVHVDHLQLWLVNKRPDGNSNIFHLEKMKCRWWMSLEFHLKLPDVTFINLCSADNPVN